MMFINVKMMIIKTMMNIMFINCMHLEEGDDGHHQDGDDDRHRHCA